MIPPHEGISSGTPTPKKSNDEGQIKIGDGKTQLSAQSGNLSRGGSIAEHQSSRITGCQMDECKSDNGYD
jgi:hypothetical protein